MDSDIQAQHHMDTCGLYCPEPVMMLHSRMGEIGVGEVLEVVATDPSTQRDIPKFCRFLGHELVNESTTDKKFYYLIRKGEPG